MFTWNRKMKNIELFLFYPT